MSNVWIVDPPERPPEPSRGTSLLGRVVERLFSRRSRSTDNARLSDAERSRREFEWANARALDMANETVRLEKWLRAAQEDLRRFIRQHPRFARNFGHRLVLTFLWLFGLPVISILLDMVLMAPAAEWLASIAGFHATLPVRIATSLVMTLAIYMVGSKIGKAMQDGDRGAAAPWMVAGALLILFFTCIGALIGLAERMEEGGVLRILPPMALGMAFPTVALLAGLALPDALDYIRFWFVHRRLSRRIEELQEAYVRAGNRTVRLFHRMHILRNRHQRRFGEDPVPTVSENLQKVVELFSRGRYRIEFGETDTEASPPRQTDGVDQAGDSRRDSARTAPDPEPAPDGGGEGPTVLVEPDSEGEPARRQEALAQALVDDSVLRPVEVLP